MFWARPMWKGVDRYALLGGAVEVTFILFYGHRHVYKPPFQLGYGAPSTMDEPWWTLRLFGFLWNGSPAWAPIPLGSLTGTLCLWWGAETVHCNLDSAALRACLQMYTRIPHTCFNFAIMLWTMGFWVSEVETTISFWVPKCASVWPTIAKLRSSLGFETSMGFAWHIYRIVEDVLWWFGHTGLSHWHIPPGDGQFVWPNSPSFECWLLGGLPYQQSS